MRPLAKLLWTLFRELFVFSFQLVAFCQLSNKGIYHAVVLHNMLTAMFECSVGEGYSVPTR